MSRPSLDAHIIQKDSRARAPISQCEKKEKKSQPFPPFSLFCFTNTDFYNFSTAIIHFFPVKLQRITNTNLNHVWLR